MLVQRRDGGKDAIARIQTEERARTGINSLKVGYNRVFGYFIEVTNTNSHLVPGDYQRRQTLTGAERYVTPALKEHVKQTVGPWKYPRWIEVVDALPKTATGKIQRFKLRDTADRPGDHSGGPPDPPEARGGPPDDQDAGP